MAKTKVKTDYAERFRSAVRLVMVDRQLETIKQAAEHLKINYMTLYKIMSNDARPTVDHCIVLMQKGGFSANWLMLDKGEVYYSTEMESSKLAKQIAEIKDLLQQKRR